MEPSKITLFEILQRRGLITSLLTRSLQEFMKRWNVDAYRAIVETHVVEESRLADVIAEEYKLTRISRLRSRPVEQKALRLLSYHDAMTHYIFPYAFDNEDCVQVAIADPSREQCLAKLAQSSGRKLVLQVAERSEIEASVQRHYPLSMQLPKSLALDEFESTHDEV